MAIIYGTSNTGGGSNKPLSEQTYEKITNLEFSPALKDGQNYYLKTSNLPTSPVGYADNSYTIMYYMPDSPVNGLSFENWTIDNVGAKRLTASTSSNDEVLSAHQFVFVNGEWQRYTGSGFTSMSEEELEHFYVTIDRSVTNSIYDMQLLIQCLDGVEQSSDGFEATGNTKVTLGSLLNNSRKLAYDTSSAITGLFEHPDLQTIDEHLLSYGQTRYIYGDYTTKNIYFYKGSTSDHEYAYIRYTVSEYDYYEYYIGAPEDKPILRWIHNGEVMDGVPPFTYDSTKVVDAFAFSLIYGTYTNKVTIQNKIEALESENNKLLKNKVYDRTPESGSNLCKIRYSVNWNNINLGDLQDGTVYNDGDIKVEYSGSVSGNTWSARIQWFTQDVNYELVASNNSSTPGEWTEFPAYLYPGDDVSPLDPAWDAYYESGNTVTDQAQLAPRFVFDTQYVGLGYSELMQELYIPGDYVAAEDITLEQHLAGFKDWQYGIKSGSGSQLEERVYDVLMSDINLDFANAQEGTIAVDKNNVELCFWGFYYNGQNMVALNYYDNSNGIDAYYHPSFNCWKDNYGNDYSTQLTFDVDLSHVENEDALKTVLGITGGGLVPITLEDRIETPLKTWIYEKQEGSGESENAIKPIFDSLPILLGNIGTFLDAGLLDDDFHRELLYQGSSNAIAWTYWLSTGVIAIDYMIPDFENDTITVYENTITPTGPNTGTSVWDVHVEPMIPEGDEIYEVYPITSQEELPVFVDFDATQAETGYSDVVALLVGEVSSSSSEGSITLEDKIADLKNWMYEDTPATDKFYTTPKWTDILTYISGQLISLSSYTAYEKQNESGPWDYIEIDYDSNDDYLIVTASFNGNMYKCFNYQYTESTSGDECDADTWYSVAVSYGPGQNPGEPGPAIYEYTELTNFPNLTIDSTAIENSDLFDTIVEHTDAVSLTLDQKIESIGGFSGDYNDLSNKPDLSIYAQTANLGTAATVDTGTGAGNVPLLDANGKLNDSVLPAIAISDTFVVSSQAAMLALTAQVGDVAVRTDLNKSYILKTAGASTLANWQELLTPTDAVQSVNGHTGAITLTQADLNIIYSSTQPSNPVTGTIWIKPSA